jgi:hypothetical protein
LNLSAVRQQANLFFPAPSRKKRALLSEKQFLQLA